MTVRYGHAYALSRKFGACRRHYLTVFQFTPYFKRFLFALFLFAAYIRYNVIYHSGQRSNVLPAPEIA